MLPMIRPSLYLFSSMKVVWGVRSRRPIRVKLFTHFTQNEWPFKKKLVAKRCKVVHTEVGKNKYLFFLAKRFGRRAQVHTCRTQPL